MRRRRARSQPDGFGEFGKGAFQVELIRQGDAGVEMRIGRLGINLDHLAETLDRLLRPPETSLNHAPRCQRPRVARINSHPVLQRLFGILKTFLAGQNQSEIHPGLGVLRIVLHGLAK